MSIDALNSLNSNSSTQLSSSSSSDKLTNATKLLLAALGIDTSKIKTESEGQLKLKEVATSQQSQQNQQTQNQQKNSGSTQIDTITKQAKELAAQIGANVSTTDNINSILAKINVKLADMTVQSTGNVEKTQKLQQYETQFSTISQEYNDYEKAQQSSSSSSSSEGQLTGSLSSMAMYNKLFFNLS